MPFPSISPGIMDRQEDADLAGRSKSSAGLVTKLTFQMADGSTPAIQPGYSGCGRCQGHKDDD
jgi:hypothetical protein